MRSRTGAKVTRRYPEGVLSPRTHGYNGVWMREDFLGGVRSGVNGTPTFLVNAVRHDGGNDLRSMLEAVQPYL
jgi:hypothetical protein